MPGRILKFLKKPLDLLPSWTPTAVAWGVVLLSGAVLLREVFGEAGAYRTAISGDFDEYILAWQRLVAGEDPYLPTGSSPYRYAPGVLGLANLLAPDSDRAWRIFASTSIGAWVFALLAGLRYPGWKSVGLLVAGIFLAWPGVTEVLSRGQIDLVILGAVVLAARLYARFPWACGLVLGLLPALKLPWLFAFVPFLFYSTFDQEKGAGRFRQMAFGCFVGWFLWAAAIPSMLFSPERAQTLSQSWVHLLRSQPVEVYLNELNQSLFVGIFRTLGESALLVAGVFFIALGIFIRVLLKRLKQQDLSEGALAWLTPWLLLVHLVNPWAGPWGTVYAVGAPFSMRCIKVQGLYRWVSLAVLLVLVLMQWLPLVDDQQLRHWGGWTWFWLALALL